MTTAIAAAEGQLGPGATASWTARALEAIPGGITSFTRGLEPPITWVRAAGAHLWDAAGRRYLDYHLAFGPQVLGHNHPAVNARVKEAIDRLDCIGVGTTDLEVLVAEKLIEHIPSAEAVLFCNSGSEATMHAVRLARAVTGRLKLIKFQGCYHGAYDSLLLNVISPPERLNQQDPGSTGLLPQALEETIVLPFNDLGAVQETFDRHPEQIAAVITEPIPHNIGAVLPQPGFLEGLRELTRRQGAVLIFDEVITGFRHALGGYQSLCGVTPDLTTLAKSMGNGYPIAAVVGRRDLMHQYATAKGGVFFGGTFNGHPVGLAATLATIEALEDGSVHQHLFRLGARLRAGLDEIARRRGLLAHAAGFGSVAVLYFMAPPVRTYADLLRCDGAKYVAFHRAMIERGIFMLPMNLKRNNLSAAHTEADVDRTLDEADRVLGALSS
ncbi:MAG TPA: aspartate aminotransferase family protein [Chloroflexota bacterium]|nr:aspartate aminotransferase family protein [Chloroflexota bacterium]